MDAVEAVIAAVIAPLVPTAVAAFGYYVRQRHKRSGLIRALMAEISVKHKHSQVSFDKDGEWLKYLLHLIEEEKPPKVSVEPLENDIFEHYKEDLRLLSPRTIQIVVEYYRIDRALSSLLSAMNSHDFSKLDKYRQEKYVMSMKRLVDEYMESGEQAISALDQTQD